MAPPCPAAARRPLTSCAAARRAGGGASARSRVCRCGVQEIVSASQGVPSGFGAARDSPAAPMKVASRGQPQRFSRANAISSRSRSGRASPDSEGSATARATVSSASFSGMAASGARPERPPTRRSDRSAETAWVRIGWAARRRSR